MGVIVLNTVLMGRTLAVVVTTSVSPPPGLSKVEQRRHVRKVQAVRGFKASVSFFFLLGIAWIVGLFGTEDVVGADAVGVVHVIFIVLIMLQALSILAFQVVLDPKVRRVLAARHCAGGAGGHSAGSSGGSTRMTDVDGGSTSEEGAAAKNGASSTPLSMSDIDAVARLSIPGDMAQMELEAGTGGGAARTGSFSDLSQSQPKMAL